MSDSTRSKEAVTRSICTALGCCRDERPKRQSSSEPLPEAAAAIKPVIMNRTRIILHPAAAQDFGRRLRETAEAVTELVLPASRSDFRPDLHEERSVTARDIVGPVTLEYCDRTGQPLARTTERGGKTVGVSGPAYAAFLSATEGIQRCKGIRDSVSLGFVRDVAFQWALDVALGVSSEDPIDTLVREIDQSVRQQTVVVPIADLYIERPFAMGDVRVIPLTRAWFEDATDPSLLTGPHGNEWLQLIDSLRKDLQGLGAMHIPVLAEPSHAPQVAFAIRDELLAALRIFSPANWMANLVCFWVPLHQEHERRDYSLLLRDGRLTGTKDTLLDGQRISKLASSDIELLERELEAVSSLLAVTDRSPFQHLLVGAIKIYSRACLCPDLADRLLYMFAAIESILLRDANEHIQHSIAERTAFILASNVPDRRRVIASIKRAYAARSRFVHHGQSIKDAEIFESFGRIAFGLFCSLVRDSARFQSRQALLDHIDHLRLS